MRSLQRLAKIVVMARLSVPIFVALCAAPASGDIYKCTAKAPIPTYQNFPCEFDSLDSMTPTSGSARQSPMVAGRGATATPASAGKHANSLHPAEVSSVPRVGMTTSEVKAIWGEPIDMSKEEFVKGDIETWTYADSRSVQFDPKGRVTSIKW